MEVCGLYRIRIQICGEVRGKRGEAGAEEKAHKGADKEAEPAEPGKAYAAAGKGEFPAGRPVVHLKVPVRGQARSERCQEGLKEVPGEAEGAVQKSRSPVKVYLPDGGREKRRHPHPHPGKPDKGHGYGQDHTGMLGQGTGKF